MNYMQAYEAVYDQIDFYYQYNYNKAYFDFKADYSFKLAHASMRIFLFKLDEYGFNMYIPHDKTDADMRQESTLHVSMQKMCNALRILQLLVVLPHLNDRTIRKLNIDISPSMLVRMHSEMPKNFNFLLGHLNELIVRFHPSTTSEEDKITVEVARGSINTVPLTSVSYDYDDVIGDQKCCFPCAFFGRKKKVDREPLMYQNDHLKVEGSIQYSRKEL